MIEELGPAWRNEQNSVEVRTDDGTIVRCWTRAVPGGKVDGGRGAKESRVRWVFETNRRQSLGPVADPATTLGQLQAIVDAWWQREKRDRADERPIAAAEAPASPHDVPVLIVTSDGSAFHCTRVGFPRSPGSGMLAEARWVFSDANGRSHIGPSASPLCSRAELRELVEGWWTARKARLSQV